MKSVKSIQPLAQAPADADQSGQHPFDFSKPFFNTATAAAYVDCRGGADALRRWLKRKGIAVGHYGREIRVAKVDLDRALGVAHRRKVS